MPMKKIYGMYVVLLLLAGGGNLKRSPVIVPFVDAVNRYTGTKNIILRTEDARLKEGSLSCMIY